MEPENNVPPIKPRRRRVTAKRRAVEAIRSKASKRRRKSHDAAAEIETRIVEVLNERKEVSGYLSYMAFYQDRFNRLSAELQQLIQLRNQFSGGVTIAGTPMQINLQPASVPPADIFPQNAPAYAGHAAPIPPTISSMPTPPRQPKPTTGNLGNDVSTEGGFE